MIWRAGLTNTPTEIIPGVSTTKIETELFVTDKAKVDKIPGKEATKKKVLQSKNKSISRPTTAAAGPAKSKIALANEEPKH